MKITTNFIKQTKRHFSASGSILLPLALKWRLVAFISGVILTVLVAPCLAPHMASATSITLTVPKEPLTFNITPSGGGTFGKSTAGTIEIQTDALAGYTLNIKAKDGKADLTNEATGSKILPINSDVPENDFMSKATYNNMWGFSFNKQGASSNTFHPIPGNAVGTKIGSTEVPNTAEDIYNIILGARVDNSLATGAYSNTFIVVASANPVPYTVTYKENAPSGVGNMPGNLTDQKTNTQTFEISSQEPTRSGYRFIGWCDTTPNKESDTVDVCQNGKSYQASDTYTLSRRDEAVTLYAMWVDDEHVMQNWKGCATAKQNEQITLVDIRDNRPYYVAQLADGNCWMTENLDLFIDKNTTYTVADTDLAYAEPEDIEACLERGEDCKDENEKYQWKPDKSTYTDTTVSKWVVNDSAANYQQSYNPSDLCWSGNITLDTTSHLLNPTDTQMVYNCKPHNESHYFLGNYYSFAAAVAQNNIEEKQNDNDAYDTSICPSGWRLPPLSGDGSFDNLFELAATNGEAVTSGTSGNIQNHPYYFTYTGYYSGSRVGGFTDRGHYWMKLRHTLINAYNLRIRGAISVPGSRDANGGTYHGFSVRCVVRSSIVE